VIAVVGSGGGRPGPGLVRGRGGGFVPRHSDGDGGGRPGSGAHGTGPGRGDRHDSGFLAGRRSSPMIVILALVVSIAPG